MDRPLEPRRGATGRLLWAVIGLAFVATLAWLVLDRAGSTTMRVDPTRLTLARVEHGQFREYFPFDGTVEPLTTVYLDIEEGGRVEEIFVDGGHYVRQGDLILRFSNATLQRNSIDTETRLVENLNTLRNTQLTLAQNALLLEEALLDLNHRIREQETLFARYEGLINAPGGTTDLSREAYERARDELAYLRDRRELLRARIAQEEILSRQQLIQAEQSIERLTLSLELLNRIVDSLEVRAPISGFLSSIDARIGENVNRGQRIGQVDVLDVYKVTVRVDQFYISRVDVGTTGRLTLDGETYPVTVQRIYPEVVNDAFRVDVGFAGAVPPNLRRGQRVSVEMSFGEPSQSLMVARGGFQQAGGRWVYLVAEDRQSATRAPARFGRQNPRSVEVLEGLKEGDLIITSSYDLFNAADELRFSEPILADRSID
jgi:HlyD family secretion protein